MTGDAPAKAGRFIHGNALVLGEVGLLIIGPSGGGKSTLMNLLLRFYEPQAGRILIDNQNISDATIASLRAVTALVSQEVVLFDDSVRANIAYGKAGATDDEIQRAAKQAHADEFIRALPQGYNTVIGPQGVKLSGGQRQRISIARAILKDAPILLLDEATSALDNRTENEVIEALELVGRRCTTVVIAHRLSTVKRCDRIYEFDGGRIKAHGTFEELRHLSESFRDLASLEARSAG